MPAARAREPGGPVALAVVALLALVLPLTAHSLVTGSVPGASTTALAVLVGLLTVTAAATSRPAAALLVSQLAVHGVLALGSTGCVALLSRAAGAGRDLAWWGATSVCAPGSVPAVVPQLALTLLLTGVALLAGLALATALGASSATWLDAAADRVVTVLGSVLTRLPRVVRLPVPPRPVAPAPAPVPLRPLGDAVRPLVRRGPPVLRAA